MLQSAFATLNASEEHMRKWLPAVFILATAAFSLAVYSRLPDPMVIHWNATGEPDGYGSRAFGAFFLPAMTLGMWGLMLAIPKLDPRAANIEKFRDTFDRLIVAVIALMCALHVAVLGSALGWPIPIGRVAPIGIGALFLFLATLFPRFHSNFFIGIRTPWTLSSETVWTKTHRFGGYAMGLMGILLIGAGLAGTRRWVLVAIWGSAALVLAILVYSYVIWRGERPGTTS
jgi:uncharacterized membrane protein